MSSTSENIGSAIKTFAKMSGAVIIQIVLFTMVGVALNLILTPFLWPELKSLVPQESNPGARAGGPVVILLVIGIFYPLFY
jgi:hypothetical protein